MKKKPEHLCVFCSGEVIKESKRIDFWWEDKLSIFENVPVGVCKECGEEYFDAKVSTEMEKKALSKEGVKKEIKVPVISF